MPAHFYDPHYGRWPCAQAFACSLPALATAHDAVSQKSADSSYPSSVSSSLTWDTLCCVTPRHQQKPRWGVLPVLGHYFPRLIWLYPN